MRLRAERAVPARASRSPSERSAEPGRRWVGAVLGRAAVLASLAASPGGVAAQGLGHPIVLHQTWNGPTMIALDYGHGGPRDGGSLSATLTRRLQIGNCPDLMVSGEVGYWNPRGAGGPSGRTAGLQGSWLLSRCPRPTSIPHPTVRIQAGVGLARLDDQTEYEVSAGVGIGWTARIGSTPSTPLLRLQPWTMAAIHRRDPLTDGGGAEWHLVGSAGLVLGVAGMAGIQASVACCDGGLAGRYGLSAWF